MHSSLYPIFAAAVYVVLVSSYTLGSTYGIYKNVDPKKMFIFMVSGSIFLVILAFVIVTYLIFNYL